MNTVGSPELHRTAHDEAGPTWGNSAVQAIDRFVGLGNEGRVFEKTACGFVLKISVCQVLANDEHNVTDNDIEFRLVARRAMLQKKVVNADIRCLGRAGISVVLQAAAEIGQLRGSIAQEIPSASFHQRNFYLYS